jgi:putative endonuclease
MSKIPGVGGVGEDLAHIYLKNKGYRIINRNYRAKYGEIDIIAKSPSGVLVFIEVKTLAGNLDSQRSLLPEDNLSKWKMRKLKRICQFFANAYPLLVSGLGWQIDLVAIIVPLDQGNNRKAKIRHYQNV